MVATDTIDLRQTIKRCADCGQEYTSDIVFCPFDGAKLGQGTMRIKLDPLIGTTVDARYLITEVLGEGGMGTVYSVKHCTLDRTFALKAMRADLAQETELAERFIREAKATAAIKHPNIVSINDFGALPDGRPYFVMEKLVGQTLQQLIKRGGAIPAARAAAITVKVARGLAAAHEAGVVHRDLKPENVFLLGRSDAGPEQDVRVVDFGAAQIAGKSRLTKAGIVYGTPYYMSPEQASGAAVDHRADIYALGVIMYEMFTGKVPFEGDTYMGVLTQHMFAQPMPPSRLDPKLARDMGALEAITLKCLEKQPSARFATMEDVVREVDKVVRVDEDGVAKVSPYLDAGASRGEPRIFAMADALELPSSGELRGRVMRVADVDAEESNTAERRGRVLLIVAGTMLVLALGLVLYKLRKSAPAEPVALVASTVSVPSSVAVRPAIPAPASPPFHNVAIDANVACEVYRGAALIGKTPLELRVEDGSTTRSYVLKAAGYSDQEVVVGATTTDRIDVSMRKRAAAVRAPPAATIPSTGPADPWSTAR